MGDIDIRMVIVNYLVILMSITFHEFAHAFVADRLGDDTPRRAGRLTLNPLVLMQAHPFGTIVVPILGAMTGFLAGFAATPVNPARVRRDITVRTADTLISIAGPLSNLLLMFVAGILAVALARWAPGSTSPDDAISAIRALVGSLVVCNAILLVFNLIPIPPLDGYHVLSSQLGSKGAGIRQFLEQWGMVLLIIVIMYGDRIIGPPIRFFVSAAYGLGRVLIP